MHISGNDATKNDHWRGERIIITDLWITKQNNLNADLVKHD